jgi:hypothetical protein
LLDVSRALVVAALAIAAPARSDDAPKDTVEPETPEISTTRRLAAIGASLVPGVLVHGSGSYVLHEKRAAKKLAVAGFIGLGALALGGATVGITGGSPYVVIWGVPLIIAGAGLTFPTWFADIWYAAGGPRVRGEPHTASAWSLDLGTTYVHDAFRERGLIRGAGRIELGRIELGAGALVDPEGRANTFEGSGRVRVYGAPARGETVTDATNVFVRTSLRRHVDHEDNVAIATLDADAGIRLDLRRIDRILDGNFLEVSLGMGVERVTYADDVHDYDTLFLGRFAWGLYLGARSELAVFYDHRRDSLAGGIAASRAAGFVGSVGTSLDLRLGGPFAFAGELEIGSAWVTTFGIRYHGGPL